jgi:hypothetical protein
MDNQAKVIRFSTKELPEHIRLDAFRDIYGRTILKHDIEPMGERPFEFEANIYAIPGLGLASSTISPCRAPRGRQHIDSDDLVLNICESGGRIVQQRGRGVIPKRRRKVRLK